jgi:tRNA(Ile)-lysidine synthase
MILDKVRETVRRYQLLRKGDTVVAAISGGPDSVVLLYMLCALSKDLKLRLHVAHLDHMLRPDSLDDKLFVEALAEKLRIPVTTARVDIKRLGKRGSLEEICRDARLDFLYGVAKKTKADKIALGHTQDDQAETILMRIIRGTGLYGLAGILPRRKMRGFEIIRPLLEVSRHEITAFLKRAKIKTRLDPSNLEDVYFRNRVRNKLLPLLEAQYNANIREVLANMAHGAAVDYEYLHKKAAAALKKIQTLKGANAKRMNLKLEVFLRLDPALQRLLLRLAIKQVRGDTRRLTFRHMREIEDLIFNRPVNSVVDLPRGVYIARKKRHLTVSIR